MRRFSPTGIGTTSWPMPLEERPDLAVEDIRALEVRRVPGRVDALVARAGNVLVHLRRQLGPDESVLVAGQEHGRHPRGGVALDGGGKAQQLVTEVGCEGRIQPRDLRVEERAHRLALTERRADGGMPQ